MKIVFFEVQEWEQPVLGKAFPDAEFVHDRLTADNAAEYADAEIASSFIASEFDEKALAKMPNLKMITTRSTGFDHIDLDVAKKRRMSVLNVPEYGSVTVAEHTFALILNLSRKIYQSVNQAKQLHFEHYDLCGFDLNKKTIGIIGLGKIGMHVMKIAQGFGMKVVVYNRSRHEELAKKHKFVYMELDELMAASDVITIHLPHNEHTHHFLNGENLVHCKKESLLINTARGGLIETEAVVTALDEGTIGGVGFDVLEGENDMSEEVEVLTHEFRKKEELKTLVLNHVLINHPKALITPHNAFNSKEALNRIMDTTIDNITSFMEGTVENSVY